MRKIKKFKVGLESQTYAISFVSEPATEEMFLAFDKDKEIEIQMQNEEKHLVCGAVLVPDRDIYRRNEKGEFYLSFTKDSIEKMAFEYLQDYRQKNVSLQHQDVAEDICLVESWVKSDPLYDKSVALGLSKDLPVGTWLASFKVNNEDTWKRIKSGELRGFSVESAVHLEEFEKDLDDMSLWNKIKAAVKEVLGEKEQVEVEDMEAQTTTQTTTETVTEAPTQTVEEAPTAIETPTETPATTEADTPTEEPKTEQPKEESNDNHVEELIRNLTDEIKALKELNSELTTKVNDLSKKPSTKRISTTPSNGNNGNTFDAWRETMRGLIG